MSGFIILVNHGTRFAASQNSSVKQKLSGGVVTEAMEEQWHVSFLKFKIQSHTRMSRFISPVVVGAGTLVLLGLALPARGEDARDSPLLAARAAANLRSKSSVDVTGAYVNWRGEGAGGPAS